MHTTTEEQIVWKKQRNLQFRFCILSPDSSRVNLEFPLEDSLTTKISISYPRSLKRLGFSFPYS